ncbi:MAG: ADP-forming succinate--CoA ligase subunit beta [Gammaproteobacteria bacterium]|nr:MAG: ADP-forming succinate--CoA ligase subunit beta [Gammaproteobacteria bacterium]
MNIHEYQAKQLLAKYGVPLARGGVAFTPEEAEKVAGDIGGSGWAVKAQILAGDRGRAGGVKLVASIPDVRETAAGMLGVSLTTPQTGAGGERVTRVYVEEACDIDRELYLGMAVDRVTSRVTLMSSTQGGTDIEAVAAGRPQSIRKLAIDPDEGLLSAQARAEVEALGLDGAQADAAERIMIGMYAAFIDTDASLVEVNPLVVTRAGDVLALDAKMSIDDNALFRHKEIEDLRDAEKPGKLERARHGFNYLKLSGNIGCLVNGAALAMATMDIIKQCGGEPANFLDVPPVASREEVAAAFRLVLSDTDVDVVLVNVIGGGITRCDAVAEGLGAAYQALGRNVPLVVRFEGTNRDLGKKTLRDMGVQFTPADNLREAAEKAVAAARR